MYATMQKGKASVSPPAMVFQGKPPVEDIPPSRSPSSQQSEVPPEIVVRGSLALEAYNKALAEGKTFDNRVPVMLIGQDRSGKTSLKKSLRGEPFNPDEESTVGIEVDPSHFRVSTEIWKAGEKQQETITETSTSYEYHIARATVENLKQGKSVLEEKIPMGATVLANDDLFSASSQDPSSPGTSSMDSELGSNIPNNIPKDIENEMLKIMQNDHLMEEEEGIYSVLWDFAGQLVYYTTHPLFLTPRAMYLLVNDLSQNPSERAKPVLMQGVDRKFEDSFGMKTNLDYLDFWMSSIASLACENERGPIGFNSEVLPEKLPPVFLVCTHADTPYDGGDPNTLAREVFGSLKTKPYNKHLHDVFVVNNTKSGLEFECPEVVRLRNEVLAIAKELPQMNETIPIKWLKFEKELRAMSKAGHKWISFKTAASIASEKCNVVDRFEFKTLLNFLHDKRILIHFDDTPELNELVVLDPQWLIDMFKKVITVRPYGNKGKKFMELWHKLEHKGILDEKLVEQVWGPLFVDRATRERLLQIMEKFSLLCPWPSCDSSCGKQYLVPSMLRMHPPRSMMKLVQVASRGIPPLFLKFESGQVPPGLFPRLVLWFLQWGKQTCLCPERTKLFHNFAMFLTSEEENWSVILLCLSSSIEVVVHRENPSHESIVESLLSVDPSYGSSDVTFPCKVRKQLGMILESMRNEFCWLKYMRYEASFICPVCSQGGAVGYCDTHHVQDCKQEECLHFWSQSQLCNAKSIVYCTRSAAVNSRVQTVQFAPWFTTLRNQLTTDQDDEDNLASVEVPPEIVVRGRRALEAYNKALAEGKTFDKRVPVMLIGQDRSGKTSLKKSLRGEPFNPDEESTVGIEVDPSHFRVSIEIWKAGEKQQETISETSTSYEYHIARATVENLKQGKSVLEEKIPMGATVLANDELHMASYSGVSDVSSTSSQNPPPPMGTTVLANNDFLSVSPDSSRCVSDVSSTSTQTTVSPASYSSVPDVFVDSELRNNISHIPEDIESEMLKRMGNDQEMEDEEGIYSVLWDFAGQLVYYATHPIFLTSRAIYLLVNDLSQNPSGRAKPVVMQGVYRKFEDSFGMKTNLDYLDFWMSSVASLACENERGPIGSNSEVLPEKLPPVFLVCTRADSPYDGLVPSSLAREIFGSLQTKPYNKHLHDVFVVDNTKSGLESECPEVVRLRNEVLAIAKELPQMKEPIPIKWLKFEKELRAMRKEKWISLKTATSIASEKCDVDIEDVKTLLDFLHDKRILIHFDDTPELNKMVVLDPQWLIDVFKMVITVKPHDCKDKKLTKLWCKLEKGILDKELLKQVWGPLFGDGATCETLLQIMEKFSLLCPWPSSDSPCGKQYLVPAMLKTHPPEDIRKLVQFASRRIPPLFIKFESGQVPPGLFPRLVLLLLQWGTQICLCPERTKLFHNFARFFTSGEGNWSVILLCLSSSVKVVVHREDPICESGVESFRMSADPSSGTSDVSFPCKVRRQLRKILESMRNEFCWLKYMRYEASFICPVCCQGGAVGYCDTHYVHDCKYEECLHFWSHSQLCNAKSIIYCTKSVAAINSRVQIDQFTPWLTSQGNQRTADQHDGDNLASVEESEAKALVLSTGVLKSLQTTCDAETAENVVALLVENLELDEATLANPGPEKTQLIRRLSMEAKNANRLDVVKYLRQITPAGTTGPLLPECRDVKAVSQNLLRKLTINLCGGEEWKVLAEKLGLSSDEIRFLDSRTRNPCIEVLSHVRNQRFIDVGTLYDALVECGFPTWADML